MHFLSRGGKTNSLFFAYNAVMYTLLWRMDTTEHIDRWYMVAVQPSLLDKTAVICAYGNKQTRWQQLYVIPATFHEVAIAQAQAIVDEKLQRGYILVNEKEGQLLFDYSGGQQLRSDS